ncbi:MAG: UDP-N-acetylmuramoyl-tripeptide--D-alanyl-D-alanine ligase [Spirochaetales bacterium]|nr:UDP-N-acetylmuramoyl-tripeptide--D-alanyl-D-alanine ligase [Spirochaetales bacterium]
MRGTKLKQNLFSCDELVAGTKGICIRAGSEHVLHVAIDSRETVSGDLFVPLKGEKVDGHNYLEQAVANGAVAVLVKHEEWCKREARLMPLLVTHDVTCITVDDTLRALQSLAVYHMRRLKHVFRIGITGSSGKTTTKEIIGAVLEQAASTIINKGNLNSVIGVPLTAFEVNSAHEYAVFEMGINHAGEMDILADIVRPDLAVITNIGTAHIGLLGSKDNIAAEKKKVTRYFDGRQKLFIHEDDEFFTYLSENISGQVIAYGQKSVKGLLGIEDLGLDGTIINWEELQIRFPLIGKHNYINALAAISVAVELGVAKHYVKRGLEGVEPLFGRSEIVKGKTTIIKDCYNANPDSVSRVLEFLNELSWKGKKIVVLGSMLELGVKSESAHEQMGKLAAGYDFDCILFSGSEARAAFNACKKHKFKGVTVWKKSVMDLAPILEQNTRPGDIVLIKGSRALELERLIQSLN